ncbi:MAG: FkbM family methyltransferase [Frankia sp.]|nr:FkbM family methyltransferase [Frankia sp.]
MTDGLRGPAGGPAGRVLAAGRIGLDTARFVWRHPEVRDQRVRALARWAGWQVWERAVGRPVTVRLPGGARMRCYPHSPAAASMLYCRLPEWEPMRFVCDALRPGDVFVDVGANVGGYTLLAAGRPGVRVVAFEPASDTFGRLMENVGHNPWLDIRAHRAAVGDGDGEVLLTVGLDTVNRVVAEAPTGAAPAAAPGPVERVPMVRLDALLRDEPVAIVKIDVEGHEPAVLAGARKLLAERRPALVVEWNDPARLGELFAELGYVAARYHPDGRRLVPVGPGSGRPAQAPAGRNVIAVPAEWVSADGWTAARPVALPTPRSMPAGPTPRSRATGSTAAGPTSAGTRPAGVAAGGGDAAAGTP